MLEDDIYTYIYDLDGNVTSKTRKSDGVIITFVWDSKGQLTGTEKRQSAGGTVLSFSSYKYDVLGRRIEKRYTIGTNPEIVRRYVYDGEEPILVFDGGNSLLETRIFSDRFDEPLMIEKVSGSQAGTYFLHANHLGSIVAITNSTGAIAQSYTYSSFGQVTVFDSGGSQIAWDDSNAIENDFTYTGVVHAYEIESSFSFHKMRNYDAENGRFLGEDPISLAGGLTLIDQLFESIGGTAADSTLYSYAGNSPLSYVDTDGETRRMIEGSAGPGSIPQFTPGQLRNFRQTFIRGGAKSLARARRSVSRKLREHSKKARKLREQGKFSSSVEREIRTFRGDLKAIDAVFGNPPKSCKLPD